MWLSATYVTQKLSPGISHDITRNQSENEAFIQQGLNNMSTVFVNFAQCFWSNFGHFMANLGAYMIKHISEIELYII